MVTDVDVCEAVSARVEEEEMHEALMILMMTRASIERDLTVRDRNQERPVVTVDLHGEDGNAFFLVSKTIHGLIKVGRGEAACEVLRTYDTSKTYDDLVGLVSRYVILEGEVF